jgi:hypothetical protein
MKKFVVLFVVAMAAVACGDEVEFSTPAIQGNFEGTAWRADYYAADIDFGGFLFEGGTGLEVLQLITPTDGIGTFDLSSESAAEAIFKGVDGTIFSTANSPDPSVTLYPVEGTISVQDIDNSTSPQRISGEFNFTAFSEDGLRSVNFIDGVFYRVPLTGGLVSLGTTNSCQEASQALNTAEQIFNNTTAGNPDYSEACNAYRDALLDAIEACGDSSGNLQTTLNDLGDCP